jgi:hypothetical protein
MATGSAGIDVRPEFFRTVSRIIDVLSRGRPHLARDILYSSAFLGADCIAYLSRRELEIVVTATRQLFSGA